MAGLARAVLILACCLAAAPATAQQTATIAIVDVQRLLLDSLAGRSIEQQLQQLRSSFSEEVALREGALREKERELVARAAILAPEALAEERGLVEQDVVALQRDVRDHKQAMEQAYGAAVTRIRESLLVILQALVEERGIDIVLARSAYLVASRRLDLTGDVLAELDRTLPSVPLALPSGG